MRERILVGATVLALTASLTDSAMAFDHKAHSGSHVGRVHAGGMHGFGPRHGGRNLESWNASGWEGGGPFRGGFIDLGPLGIMAACGVRYGKADYCGPGYSVSAWSR